MLSPSNMQQINLKEFRQQMEPYNISCPFCRGKTEMYYSGRCPACNDTRRIEPVKAQ